MKEAKRAIWLQILVISCLHISCQGAEQKISDVKRTLETFPIQSEEFPPGQTEKLKNRNNETGVSDLARKWRTVSFPTSNGNWNRNSSAGNSVSSKHRFEQLRQQEPIFRDDYSGGSESSSDFFFDSNQPLNSDEECEDCGNQFPEPTARKRVKRIVGGRDAGIGNFPWMARIHISDKLCGGSLVDWFHVVTAMHCVDGVSLEKVKVILGDNKNTDMASPDTQAFKVSQIIGHPGYKSRSTGAVRFDLAVLRLDRPVDYSILISPIKLPGQDESFVGQIALVAGWGIRQDSRIPDTLQVVEVPVISNPICKEWHRWSGINLTIFDEMICAGYFTGGKNACNGDSGGPLMIKKKDGWYLIGVVSSGYSCAGAGEPEQYLNVAKTVDWIKGVIDSNPETNEIRRKRRIGRIRTNIF